MFYNPYKSTMKYYFAYVINQGTKSKRNWFVQSPET